MLHLLVRILASLGSSLTALGLLATDLLTGVGRGAVYAVLILALAVIVWDVVDYWRHRPAAYAPNDPAIVEYLCKWLEAGGRTAILTRDLSWAADDDAAAAILVAKADRGELLTLAGRSTPLLARLKLRGADVHNYSPLGFEPKSRFTIINHGQAGARLAIGIGEGKKHVIREFGSADPFIMALANDLVALAQQAAPRA